MRADQKNVITEYLRTRVDAFADPADMMRRWMAEQDLPEAVIGPYILLYLQPAIGYCFDFFALINTVPQLRRSVLLMHGEYDIVAPVS